MASTHKEFREELKVTSKKQKYDHWASRKKILGEDHSIDAYKEYLRWRKEGERQHQESKKQMIKNRYQNWVLKRKAEHQDYSIDLFQKLQKYLIREEQKMQELMHTYCQIAEKKHIGHMVDDLKDDDVVYEAREMLFQWREKDGQYQAMQKEIEELRYISNKPVPSSPENSR